MIIMTSNVGSRHLSCSSTPLSIASGDADAAQRDVNHKVMARFRECMRPAFLNRIDGTVLFTARSREQLHRIVALQLRDSQDRLDAQGVKLEIHEPAMEWIAEAGSRLHDCRRLPAAGLTGNTDGAVTVVSVDAPSFGLGW
ncbi:AAA family ATPase [Enteractinococcus helveticum]|uniref:AAA family ATPase n=1 Tax=Enteractinococcus helveticum TaxID=1837282 RepID=UPI0012378B82|nr:AAA family ATPase [Enteractinococcus helveticum]